MAAMVAPGADVPRPWSRHDLAAIAVLVATAFVIGAPILAGGYLTYLDNPAHIAEIRALASPEGADGWTEIGFAGVSLDALHSPLFWRGLAALDRLGVAFEPIYGVLVCLAIAAPGVALYAVARRRLPCAWAAGLAYLLLIQRFAIVGFASASGGMWTMSLASGALILLVDRLARPTTTARDAAAIGALLGFVGVTHLYVLEAAILVFVVHWGWLVVARRTRADAPDVRAILRRDAIGGVLAVAASIVYWFPIAVSGGGAFQPPQNFDVAWLAQLLLLAPAEYAPALPFGAEIVTQGALIAAGLAGMTRLRRRDPAPVGAYGAGLVIVVAALLVFVRVADSSLLGPNSWRFLYFIRVGCALAAIPLVAWAIARWRARRPAPAAGAPSRRRTIALGTLGAAAVAAGLFWGSTTRREVFTEDDPEMAEVRALWAWMRQARAADWGRVYVQDTLGAPPVRDRLASSHVLALTLSETGSPTLGAFYTVIPAATARWLAGDFGQLFGRRTIFFRQRDGKVGVQIPLATYGVTHVVTAGTRIADELAQIGQHPVHEVGRFAVFRFDVPPAQRAPIGVATADGLAFELTGPADGAPVPLAHAHHPFWRLAQGPPGAHLVRGERGLMTIVGLPPGTHPVRLVYAPPRLGLVSVAGWLGILALAGLGHRRWRRAQG